MGRPETVCPCFLYLHKTAAAAQTVTGDDMLDSIWAFSKAIPEFPALEGDTETDVLILGGGMAGLLTAYEMKQAGIDYLLIEADEICSGITRNTTAKITSQHGLIYQKLLRTFGAERTKLYWQANEQALARFRALSRSIPCDFETKDSYVYCIDTPEKLEQELSALSRLNIPAEFAEELPLPLRTAGAVKFPNQAQFHPLKFAAGIARDLNVWEHTKALSFAERTVVTNHGRIKADNIVMTTHFPILNKHGGYFLKLYQSRSYVLGLENGPDVNGMYLDEAEGGLSFRNYKGYLLLGGGGHRTGKQNPGWTKLETVAKAHYPASTEAFRWAAQDCMSLDGIPYIGRYGRHTHGLYVASGFNKWGMTSSMVAASLLRDLIQGKDSPYAEVFSPQRTSLRPQLLINAMEATANLLTPTTPRCPHMGCALKWNPNERSWDCPCHGSRFTHDGKLLDGPATGDLK